MENIKPQTNTSNFESVKSAALLSHDELKNFRKLSKEEQKKQKEDRLKKLEELQNNFRKAVEEATKTGKVEEAQKLKVAFDKNAEELKQLIGAPEISAEYICKDEKGKETKETITLNIDEKIEQSKLFYNNHKIELPDDFEDKVNDIWENNQDEILKEIQKKGFDEVLIVPGGLSVPELHKKMTVGYNETYESDNFKEGKSFKGVIEKTDKTRIVLLHSKNAQNLADRPELSETKGKTAEVFIKAGEKLTLTDYLIFQKQFFEATGKHLDEEGYTWLPGSTVKKDSGGVRVIDVSWGPGYARLFVSAFDAGYSYSSVGCRLSRSFY